MEVGKIVVLQHINGALILGRVLAATSLEDEADSIDVVLEKPLVFMEDRHPQTGAPIVRIQPWGTSFVEETTDEVPFELRLIERVLTPKAGLENVWIQHTSKLDLTTQVPNGGKSPIIT